MSCKSLKNIELTQNYYPAHGAYIFRAGPGADSDWYTNTRLHSIMSLKRAVIYINILIW